MRNFTRDGVAIAFTDSGAPTPDAETIVFGHGMLFGGWMFRSQIEALAPTYRCVTIDWRGQGGSSAPIDGYDMDTLTDDLVALIERLDVAPVHYVGLSMGGFVGMRLAARHPELVRTLTLLSTSAELDDHDGSVETARIAGQLWAFGTSEIGEGLKPGSFGAHFLASPDSSEIVDEWLGRIEANDRRGLASAMMGVIRREPVASELAKVKAPTLVVHGEQDGMPLSCGRGIAAAIDGARFEALPLCGHACTLEQPAQVTRLLADFLADQCRSENDS